MIEVLRHPVESALAPLVTVVDEIGVRFSSSDSHGHRLDDQFAGLSVAHRPADQPSATEIPHAGEEELALPGRELGDVSHPPLIGSGG
jgi:hypothetical protein